YSSEICRGWSTAVGDSFDVVVSAEATAPAVTGDSGFDAARPPRRTGLPVMWIVGITTVVGSAATAAVDAVTPTLPTAVAGTAAARGGGTVSRWIETRSVLRDSCPPIHTLTVVATAIAAPTITRGK